MGAPARPKVGETRAGAYAARTGEYDDCFGNGEHERKYFLAGDWLQHGGIANFLQRDSISTPVGGEPCSGPGGAPRLDDFGFAAEYKKLHSHDAPPLTNCTLALAERTNQTPAQLALRWARQQEYMGAIIIGATTLEQLQENINAFNMGDLDAETLAAIDAVDNTISPAYYKGVQPGALALR